MYLNFSCNYVQLTSPGMQQAELLPSRKVVGSYMKSRNRGNLAALLNAELFDKEVRRKSNVRGRGKEKLDTGIIE